MKKLVKESLKDKLQPKSDERINQEIDNIEVINANGELDFKRNGKPYTIPSKIYRKVYERILKDKLSLKLVNQKDKDKYPRLEIILEESPVECNGWVWNLILPEYKDKFGITVAASSYRDKEYELRLTFEGRVFDKRWVVGNAEEYQKIRKELLKQNPHLIREFYEKNLESDEMETFTNILGRISSPEDLKKIRMFFIPHHFYWYIKSYKEKHGKLSGYEKVLDKINQIYKEIPEYLNSLERDEVVDYIVKLDKDILKLTGISDYSTEIFSTAYQKMNTPGKISKEKIEKVKKAIEKLFEIVKTND